MYVYLSTVQVGDKVVRYNRRKDTRMGDKLAPRYYGPFTIIEELGKGVFRLSDVNGPVAKTVNSRNLKRWKERPPVEPVDPSSPVKPVDPSMSPEKSPTSTGVQSPAKSSQPWIVDLNLSHAERELLASGGWLNDRLIDAINGIVSNHIGSLMNQSTVMVQTRAGFSAVTCDSIVILHDENHWVTTACLGKEVLFMDSLHGSISPYVRGQMRQLYASLIDAKGQLRVTILPCATQPNCTDCGVYAAAFAFHLALGGNGNGNVQDYDHAAMRPHLQTCLESSSVKAFPIVDGKKRGRKPQKKYITV